MAVAPVPRLGLFAYAVCIAAEIPLGLWSQHLIERAGAEGFQEVEKQLDVLEYGYVALGIAGVMALVAVTGMRQVMQVRRAAIGAAVAAAVDVLLEVGQRLFIAAFASSSGDRLESIVRAFGTAMVLASTVTLVLVVVVAVRVGRAVAAPATVPLGVAAFVVVGVGFALFVVGHALGHEVPPVFQSLRRIVYYASAALVAVNAIHAGWSLARVQERVAPDKTQEGLGELSPGWRTAAGGIELYLWGAAARVLCAVLGYAAMSGASRAARAGDLHGTHDAVMAVAVLSGLASLAMLVGVWRITRAPAESGGAGPAMITLMLMVLGLCLELATTGITLEALGGSLSAAFFAMDALPVLASVAALLGMGAGAALLRSFGNMAQALGATELHGRARSATALLVIAGASAGLAMLGLQHMPVEVLGLLAVIVLPVAIAALVQFLRVAVPLGQVIRARLAGA
jgi:hypothetical protein